MELAFGQMSSSERQAAAVRAKWNQDLVAQLAAHPRLLSQSPNPSTSEHIGRPCSVTGTARRVLLEPSRLEPIERTAFMSDIKIHVLHTGQVCVAPGLPFGGEGGSIFQAAGIGVRQEDRLWLPVSAYLVEHPKGLMLVDTGWHRDMSPDGVFDRKAQIESLGSPLLYKVNQGVLPHGEAIDEQLAQMGIAPSDLDYVLLTHLDCDHANGLKLVTDAKRILASRDEIDSVKNGLEARIRYQSRWWDGTKIEYFDWNDNQGPFQKSYDLFGDGSVECVAIPGHADGLFAVKVTGADGRFVLLFSDGGYAERSWRDMVLSGIANNREQQKKSLRWIREQSLDPLCVESLANHDPDVNPHVIEV